VIKNKSFVALCLFFVAKPLFDLDLNFRQHSKNTKCMPPNPPQGGKEKTKRSLKRVEQKCKKGTDTHIQRISAGVCLAFLLFCLQLFSKFGEPHQLGVPEQMWLPQTPPQ